MRPSPGGDNTSTKPRSRKSSVADHAAVHTGPSSHVPTTFFLKSEEDFEQPLAGSQSTDSSDRQKDNTFGVQSLADTLDTAFGHDDGAAEWRHGKTANNLNNGKQSPTPGSHGVPSAANKPSESSTSPPSRKDNRRKFNHAVIAAQVPFGTESQSLDPTSAMPSTPKSISVQSLKLSDEECGSDDVASQAILSSGEEDDEETQQGESGSFPQLVMPSIQMPKRRPFTAKGKAMGNLKVLIAGASGVGKTSLVRSIVQLCEDIVHVDPLSPSQSFFDAQLPKSRKHNLKRADTARISEIHASTKSYPHWWTDFEESRPRRRKSSIDSVLERNLCFIDTPGFGESASNSDEMKLVVDYVESLLYQTSSVSSMEDNDLLGIVAGSGGVQVDLVLYLLRPSHDISNDVEFMQRLSGLTNVIPIISKSDTLARSEIVAVKTSILARLQSTSIRPFFFGKDIEDALLDVQGLSIPKLAQDTSTPLDDMQAAEASQYPFNLPTYPYAVSSTPGPDSNNMDASLLMSPDYIQPLLPSELNILVDQVFDPESIAWLRHSAAKKFLAWRRRTKLPGDSFILHGLRQNRSQRGSISSSSFGLNGAAMHASGTPSIFSAASPSGVLVPRAASPFYPSNLNSNLHSPLAASSPSLSHSQPEGEGPTELSLARYNNYAQGEQRLAEVRLAKWAQDLQRSLRNERERYEDLQRNERAKWLLERVGEEVRDGNIITTPNGSPRAEWAIVKHRDGKDAKDGRRYSRTGTVDSRDPLGLCELSDEVRRRGFVIVKVLGGMSVLGAVMVAVVRACGAEVGLSDGGVWSWLTGGVE